MAGLPMSNPPRGMDEHSGAHTRLTRRAALRLGGALAAGAALTGGAAWMRRREGGMRAEVCIVDAPDYERDLAARIADGLAALSIGRADVRGKRVLLKPNLVETAVAHAHINTHPALVVAAAEAFARLGAAQVIVAEGQGHRRDSWIVLEESGMCAALRSAGLPFVDLNHDDVRSVANRGAWTTWNELHLPETLLRADLVVSLPKLKTHHWVGVTCAMKNLFGVMPGVVYGWPKNVLHYAGIDEAILDINATVRPWLAIVDGVVGMEGDGPIMGTPKPLGALVLGRSLPAVDATCARLMGLNPRGVGYLKQASGRLGPVLEGNIAQRGEPVERYRTTFALLDEPHLRAVRGA